MRSMATTCSSVSRRMRRTPWVLRPMVGMPLTGMRISLPPLVINIRSSSSVTRRRPTTLPLRSLALMVMTPLPPRFLVG